MRIGLDAMGGDYAPFATVVGALEARQSIDDDDKIVLFGKRELIEEEIAKSALPSDHIEIVDCPEVIGSGDSPIKAFSQKKYSSLTIGFTYLKGKKIDAFASAGNTGAMLVGTMYTVDSIPGVIRPCIATLVPRVEGGTSIMLDVGINADCKPDVLYQFAILGKFYSKHVLGVKNPNVGLLNIGAEEKKGNILMQTVYQSMKGSTDFNFIGNIEGNELFSSRADVIITDGFTGNIVMKQVEGFYTVLNKRGVNDEFLDRFNYESYGGTPILGANAPVIIGHGISNPEAIKNMILQAQSVYKSNLISFLKRAFRKYRADRLSK